MDLKLKSYKKDFDYSYTFGAFPTMELINFRRASVIKVLVSSNYDDTSSDFSIYEVCKEKNIEVEVNDKQFNRLSPKENCYIIGAFKKFDVNIEKDKNHVVLVNPSNMGNIGTIIRTMIGFGIDNLAVIGHGADIFNPKVIRASMGAIFKLNFKHYDSFEDYMSEFKNHDMYPFMLKGAVTLDKIKVDNEKLFSLIFGNEATGLSDDFLNYGKSVFIPHYNTIDSLNLTIAAGIALYEFSSKIK